MEWVERTAGGQEVRHSRTPETSGLRLLWINLLAILPEWMQVLSRLSPATYVLDGVRAGLLDGVPVTALWYDVIPPR